MPSIAFVSVVIPCLNEEKHIGACLDSLLASDYNHESFEIIVVDGMSQDRTRQILEDYQKLYPVIRVLDNPQRRTAAAMNIGIRAARGDVIIRADAHTLYASDYISTLVNGLDKYHADNIGGVRETLLIKDSPLTLALSIAISHPFTAGNAYFRTGTNNVREVDTVFCGCFRKELFDKIGLFNERIVRTEDRELNARILANGGRIVLDPKARCVYIPRTDFLEYIKWIVYGPYKLFRNHVFTSVNMVAWRNFVPALFVFWHIVALGVLMLEPVWGALVSLPLIAYWLMAIFLAAQVAIQHRSVALWPAMLLAFVATHYSYGLGSLAGIPWFFWARLQRRFRV